MKGARRTVPQSSRIRFMYGQTVSLAYKAATIRLIAGRDRRRTMLLEGLAKFRGNLFRTSAFDLVALHHVDKLAVFQKSD